VALADAEAGDLDKAAQVDVVADVGATDLIGAGEESRQRGGVFFAQPVEYLVVGHARHCGDSGLHVDVALAGADGGDHRLGDALLLVVPSRRCG